MCFPDEDGNSYAIVIMLMVMIMMILYSGSQATTAALAAALLLNVYDDGCTKTMGKRRKKRKPTECKRISVHSSTYGYILHIVLCSRQAFLYRDRDKKVISRHLEKERKKLNKAVYESLFSTKRFQELADVI